MREGKGLVEMLEVLCNQQPLVVSAEHASRFVPCAVGHEMSDQIEEVAPATVESFVTGEVVEEPKKRMGWPKGKPRGKRVTVETGGGL